MAIFDIPIELAIMLKYHYQKKPSLLNYFLKFHEEDQILPWKWYLEAATRSNSTKKVFLKISHKSQENNCCRVFLNKVSGWKKFDGDIFFL